jgi:hypothetical protein
LGRLVRCSETWSALEMHDHDRAMCLAIALAEHTDLIRRDTSGLGETQGQGQEEVSDLDSSNTLSGAFAPDWHSMTIARVETPLRGRHISPGFG